MSEDSKRKKLVQLIRQIVKEEIAEALDIHLEDYEHKQKEEEVISF